MKGILNVNKPKDMTSFDVVAILRKILGEKRIGHTGTLDPMATGVLPVTIGRATRIMDYLDSNMKEYVGEFTFGVITDTDDIWGNIIERKSKDILSALTKERVKDALTSFRGVIDQVPPKYSALKVEGKKLYQYAREGKPIEIKPRKIYIDSIELMDFTVKDDGTGVGVFRISCSKGTYIRSIARDLGEVLKTGSAMSGLIRTKSGNFDIGTAIPMDELRKMSSEEIASLLIPSDMALEEFNKTELGPWESKLFINGVPLRKDQWQSSKPLGLKDENFPLPLPEYYERAIRVYGKTKDADGGMFLGMGLGTPGGELKAHKVLLDRE